MISRTHRILYSALVLVLLLACTFTDALVPNGQNYTVPPTATRIPFVAENDGPPGFSAALSAPDIVALTWQAVPEAVGYKVQIVFDGLDPLTLAYLPPDVTSFEHLLAPEASLLTYRLQTVTADGPAGASSLQIATGSHAPNPLTVQAAFSETGVASAVIGPAGGTLETTDSRGVTYTLVIPPGAIGPDLEITMTPVTTIGGWPLDGDFLGAVRLEPEGWLLDEVAYLTIRLPAAADPALTTVGFAFDGSGEEFHLTPADDGPSPLAGLGTGSAHAASPVRQGDAGSFNLPVTELGSKGVGETSADSAAAMAREHSPTSSSHSADQKAAATDAALDELAPLWTDSQFVEVATDNLLDQILNNIKDCYDFKRAVGSFHAWERSVSGRGDTSSLRETIVGQLAEQAVKVIENAGQECAQADEGVVPASVPCAEKLTRAITSGSDPFYSELQHEITKDPALKLRFTQADDASEQCPHSFGVVDSVQAARWVSACIPTLNRSYQVGWITPISNRVYRLYPSSESDPFSGRVEGQEIFEAGGMRSTIVIQGTYAAADIVRDNNGNLQGLTLKLSIVETITACVEGKCVTTSDSPTGLGIPLTVRKQRCPIP